ncbi:zincin-like metallopeptidase domain-containing protein, partial [Mesorhizobium sp. M4B.F.Ca.ET.013.02.1.1]|uniref:zincin-like metallopeptidase domain-containing protein n=1 Tax=Mesorhizobium sp. M4B.F.Ca.ET.013.02.1.1 TaxID=2496755 RepID=UPI001FDF95D4
RAASARSNLSHLIRSRRKTIITMACAMRGITETCLPFGYIAELGAAFLCADLQLTPETRDDHAAYVASWLKVLKNDTRAIFTAASHAGRAVEFLHARAKVEGLAA